MIPKTTTYWLARLLNAEDPVKISKEHTTYVWQEVEEAAKTAKFEDMGALLREAASYVNDTEDKWLLIANTLVKNEN